MAKARVTSFRCTLVGDTGNVLGTSILVNIPPGLTRQQAFDYATGRIAGELSRYAVHEAMGLGPYDNNTDWNEIVT